MKDKRLDKLFEETEKSQNELMKRKRDDMKKKADQEERRIRRKEEKEEKEEKKKIPALIPIRVTRSGRLSKQPIRHADYI